MRKHSAVMRRSTSLERVGSSGVQAIGAGLKSADVSRSGQRGAALLLVLVLVVVLGLAAAMAGQSWSAMMQREREAELLFRGQQFVRALESYYNVKHGAQQMFPTQLEHLLRDPRFPGTVRHLRKIYLDPMTGKELVLVKDPAERIIGVRSDSEQEPFQKDGFPKDLEKLKDKASYREWEFVYVPPKTRQRAAQGRRGQTTPMAKPAL